MMRKSLISEILESLLGKKMEQMFDEMSKDEKYQEETFEMNRGSAKNVMKVKFNEKGFIAAISVESELILSPEDREKIELHKKIEQLKEEKQKAIDAEDFLRAAEIRDQLKELNKE